MQASEIIKQVENYYFSTKLEEVRMLQKEGRDIINLGIGSPDLETPDSVIRVLNESSKMKGSGQYQPYRGVQELRIAFSEWYKRIYKVNLDPDREILPLMGSKEAVMHIHLAFCNPGDTVLIPNPGYPTYSSSAKMLGLNVVYYNLSESNHWMPSIEELKQLHNGNCKVMWLNYPNMPTGAIAEKQDLEKLIAFAQENNILLVNDNPYSLILNDSPLSIHSCETVYEDILELNSLSKSHNMSGWRVGVISGSEVNINHLVKVKSNFDSGMYKPIQLAAVEALSLGNKWSGQLNIEYGERRKIIWEILDELSCLYNRKNAGLFVWAKVSEAFKNGAELSDYLLYELDIFATPGMVFGSQGEKYIRFSLCAKKEHLKEALKRIKNRTL